VLLFLIPSAAALVLLILFWKLFHIPPTGTHGGQKLQTAG
jgi:hypothetical protein